MEERIDRAADLLRSRKIRLSHDFLEVLAHCDSASEIWFIYPIISMAGWKRVGPRTLSNKIYTLTVKGFVGEDVVDILLEDHFRRLRIVFEIQGPKPYLSGKAAALERRQSRIRRRVNKLYIVPAGQARSLGKNLRRDLLREQVSHLLEHQKRIPTSTGLHIWHGSDLAYDVSELLYEARLPLLGDWLVAHGFDLNEEMVEVLGHCQRAGELWFALQFIDNFDCVPCRDDRTILIAETYRLRIQPKVESYTAGFLIEPVSRTASRAQHIIEINPPPHHPRDVRSDKGKDRDLSDLGYQVQRVDAEDAKHLGYRWVQIVMIDIRGDR